MLNNIVEKIKKNYEGIEEEHPVASNNMWEAYVKALRCYVQFKGRTCRYDYWAFFTMSSLVNFLVIFIIAVLPFRLYFAVAYGVFLSIPSLAICSRRLHDINLSFLYWYVLPLLVCMALRLLHIGNIFDNIFGIYAFFIAVVKGTDHNNVYGKVIKEDVSHDKRAKWMIFFNIVIIPVLSFLVMYYFVIANLY